MSIALMTFDIFGTVLDWAASLRQAPGDDLSTDAFNQVIDRRAVPCAATTNSDVDHGAQVPLAGSGPRGTQRLAERLRPARARGAPRLQPAPPARRRRA